MRDQGNVRGKQGKPRAKTRRRALELLAGSPQEGVTDSLLLAHGFTVAQMVELVRAGLASVTPQRIRAGGKAMEVATLGSPRRGGGRSRNRNDDGEAYAISEGAFGQHNGSAQERGQFRRLGNWYDRLCRGYRCIGVSLGRAAALCCGCRVLRRDACNVG
jgi:hypothetical protein